MNSKICKTLVTTALSLAITSTAHAVCSVTASSATPFQIGPPNPNNGFAEYLTDSTGLSLELCLNDPALCFFDPVDPASVFSQQIGFGFEGFWWLAQPVFAAEPAGMRSVLVMGAEAAFLGDIVEGGQFPFTRLRVRLDLPAVGFYRVTEPFGIHEYDITALVAGDEVFDSFDVEFPIGSVDANGVITEATSANNCVSPFLTWDTFDPLTGTLPDAPGGALVGYIGDNTTPHAITSPPGGVNFFRIEAWTDATMTTPLPFDPTDVDVNGSTSSIETDQFVVMGKLYDGSLATPLVAERTTYSRTNATAGQVDVFATGALTAIATATGGPNVGGPFPLQSALGQFFESTLLTPDALVVPPTIDIDGTDGGAAIPTDPTHLVRALVDLVTITRAEYDLGTVPPSLTVDAMSSDALAIPALTLVELNQSLTAGSIVVTEASPGVPLAPPGVVTVSSTAGGSATRLVEVINSDLDGDGIPNDVDNCPLTPNPGQEDVDGDGIGDVCDVCPGDPTNDADNDQICAGSGFDNTVMLGDQDNCPVNANQGQEDADSDGVGDACDNCINAANGTLLPAGQSAISQRDTDGDGFGNRCDADFDGSLTVNTVDFARFRSVFGQSAPGVSPFVLADHADLNGDGVVNTVDFAIFRSSFGSAPGPSAFNP